MSQTESTLKAIASHAQSIRELPEGIATVFRLNKEGITIQRIGEGYYVDGEYVGGVEDALKEYSIYAESCCEAVYNG